MGACSHTEPPLPVPELNGISGGQRLAQRLFPLQIAYLLHAMHNQMIVIESDILRFRAESDVRNEISLYFTHTQAVRDRPTCLPYFETQDSV